MNVEIKREGIVLRGKLEKPALDKCPAAILFHGFTGDLGYGEDDLYSVIARGLTERGIAVIRFDFDGHGKSGGRFSEMDIFKEIEDAIEILKYVRSLEFVTDIYVIGHSQGGVVGGMLAGYYADIIKKLVLLAPAATLKDDALKGTCMGTEYDTNHIPDVVKIGEEGKEVGGQYFRIAKLLPIYEVTREFKGPALAIHGLKDVIVDSVASRRYGETMENCQVELFGSLDHGIEGEEKEKAIEKLFEFLK